MSRYFGRLAAVQIEVNGEDPILLPISDSDHSVAIADQVAGAPSNGFVGANAFQPSAPTPPQGASLSDKIHIKFQVEKDVLGQPNRMDLSIFNLSQNTQKQLKTNGYVVLKAGFQDDKGNLPVLFAGTSRTIDHEKIGPHWVTRIQCGDGETVYQFGKTNQSWGAGVAKADIAVRMAQDLQAADPKRLDISGFLKRVNPTGAANPSRIIFSNTSFSTGYAAFGSSFDELQKLLGPNYKLCIQNGELLALNPSDVVNRQAYVLDQQHGLIGTPAHCSPNPGSSISILKATSLLNGRFSPGVLIRIGSVDTSVNKQNYRIQKATHIGDLSSNEWQTDLEMVPLLQPPK